MVSSASAPHDGQVISECKTTDMIQAYELERLTPPSGPVVAGKSEDSVFVAFQDLMVIHPGLGSGADVDCYGSQFRDLVQ
ncbi:hypothetical protein GCM10027596_40880 [Nocardioides korecus]